MIDDDWEKVKQTLAIGDTVEAVVTAHEPFGVFVHINGTILGILERIQMNWAGYRTPDDYPPVGAHIACKVLGFRDYCKEVEVGLRDREPGPNTPRNHGSQ